MGLNNYVEDTVVPITATPDAGNKFVNWTGGTVADSNAASTTIIMDRHKTITANFSLIPTPTPTSTPTPTPTFTPTTEVFMLTVNTSGSGEANGTGAYTAGTRIAIVALPESDEWVFDRWTGDVSMIDDPNAVNTHVTVNDNFSITANFKLKSEEKTGFPLWIIGAIIGGVVVLFGGYLLSRQLRKKVEPV